MTTERAHELGLGEVAGVERYIRSYRNGRDLTDTPRGVFVIDLFGLSEHEVRARFPAIYQHVLDHVRPEREQNSRAIYRQNWWIHGEPRAAFRPALDGLPRYIATVETAKHRHSFSMPAWQLIDCDGVRLACCQFGHLVDRIRQSFGCWKYLV
ncbi:MAG: hypothetical protein IPO95_08710 [Rhodanobacteraceae bacterium]|nr:hypothetical protein [Rhodanobacteraceae bacterium]